MPDKNILPPRPDCKIKNLPREQRTVIRHIIMNIVRTYPQQIESGLGLEKNCEVIENLINKGYLQLCMEPAIVDVVGSNDLNHYFLMFWDDDNQEYCLPPSMEAE